MNAGRRHFARLLAAGACVAWAGRASAANANARPDSTAPLPRGTALRAREKRTLVRPARLRAQAVVGLIAPGGVVDDSIIEQCVRNLESIGLDVRPGTHIRAARGGYAGTVEQRLDDLHAMFGDREVRAIFTARGGSGCTALLPHIRYDFVRAHPKILIGYSDITALHLALLRQAGLITFHGPVAWSTFSSYSVEQMLAVLSSPQATLAMTMAAENRDKAATQPQYRMRTLVPGVAEGQLIGGNLSIVAALAGTPFMADFHRRILFLEDVGEAPYRIDRMLTQLDQSVGLARAAGVLLGIFQKSAPPDREPSLTLDEVFEDHFAGRRVPAVCGWSLGHVSQQMTLPLGVRARMDTERETLTLLEPAVS